jgi:hypothetical protein
MALAAAEAMSRASEEMVTNWKPFPAMREAYSGEPVKMPAARL